MPVASQNAPGGHERSRGGDDSVTTSRRSRATRLALARGHGETDLLWREVGQRGLLCPSHYPRFFGAVGAG